MKRQTLFGKWIAGSLLLACFCFSDGGTAASRAAEPKRLLVVTTTTGFRHSSIETGEKILAQLGKESGAFTVDYARVTPPAVPAPKQPTPPKEGSDVETFKADQEKYKAAMEKFKADE